MDYILNDNIENTEQIEETICEQKSVLFPGFVVTTNGILEKHSGKLIDDVSIHFLGLSTRACNVICRWGMSRGKLIDSTVMLSALLLLSEDDIKGFQNIGKKTWDEIYSTFEAYLSGDGEFSQTEVLQSTEGAILADWMLSGTNLMHIKSGKVINDAPISALHLNIRAMNGLTKAGIQKISDFIGVSYEGLLEIRNLGVGTIASIIDKLKLYVSKRAEEEIDIIAQNCETSNNIPSETGFVGEVVIPSLDPSVPVLADEYALVNGRIFRRCDYAQIADAPIGALNLSVRGTNCLKFHGIVKVSQLVGMPFEDFRNIRNLGVGTSNEIIEKLDLYLSSRVIEGESTNIKVLPTDKILEYFKEYPFAKFSEEDAVKLFGDDQESIFSAIDTLLENETLVFENGLYCKQYPSFYQVLETVLESANESDQRCANVLLMRSKGNTLEEIGHSMSVTRERIRQMENKMFRKIIKIHNGLFAEDQFAYLVENYSVFSELLLSLVNGSHQVLYYLSSRYVGGKRDLEEALDDKKLQIELRRKIEKWIYKDYLFVDGDRIPLIRKDIEDLVLKKYCANGCSYDEFCELYNKFILSRNLSADDTSALLISEDVKRSRNNRLSESKKLLWSQNQHIRYYDIASIDTSELFDTLNLAQFENIEISTRKFIQEYPELMEKYDIRDEYELHNLLKKLPSSEENPNIHFAKMPIIQFGVFDREQVVKDMLFALAPISAEDLADRIAAEYGHRADVVRSSWFVCIDEYYHQGVFSVDYEAMSDEHMQLIMNELYDDFYYFSDIKKIYRNLIPNADLSLISPFNLKRMGFEVNGIYAYRNYDSAEAYFNHLFTCREIVDASQFHSRLNIITMYNQVWKKLRRDYDIIEFEPMQYINISRLQKLGVTKDQLRNFCDEVYNFVEKHSYFTIEYLKRQGFTSAIDSLGFDTQFYISLLREDSRFANWQIGRNVLFFAGEIKMFVSGNNYISIKSFVADYLEKVRSIDIDELVSIFEDEYNIKLEKSKIIEESKDTNLYYDRIMEKLYVDYDTYFEEI